MFVDIQFTKGSMTLMHVCRLDHEGEMQVSLQEERCTIDFRMVVASRMLFLTMDTAQDQPIGARWRCAISDIHDTWLEFRRMWNYSGQPWSCRIRRH